MESLLSSTQFKILSGNVAPDSKYNSIRDRICTINAKYFERLFERVFSVYNKELAEEHALLKADSTYVALATKLFSSGMENGTADKRYVKYSVSLKGSLPCNVKIFTDQSYVNEDRALGELVQDNDYARGHIVVFDRGLQSRKSFEQFTDDGKWFVTRTRVDIRCKVISSGLIPPKPRQSTVTITADQTGYLINRHEKRTTHSFRVIKAIIDKTGEQICFVTNMVNENPYMIASWYKQRWEIECFFKFIKQHLNAKHLVSGTPNGITVMLYMTMILAILIIAYKKLNKISSFKIAKLKFGIELENEMIKEIVLLCGGDPNKAANLFNST